MSQFKQMIFDVVASIPAGKVMTYAQVARATGIPKSARAVGNALHKNTNPKLVPCHRVVSSTGKVSLNYRFVWTNISYLFMEKQMIISSGEKSHLGGKKL